MQPRDGLVILIYARAQNECISSTSQDSAKSPLFVALFNGVYQLPSAPSYVTENFTEFYGVGLTLK